MVMLAGLVVPVAWFIAGERGVGLSRFLAAASSSIAAVTLVLLLLGLLANRPYGDGAHVVNFLSQGQPFPRWLLGLALAEWLFVGLWKLPPLAATLPGTLATPAAFVSLLGTLCMWAGTMFLLRRYPNRLSIALPVLTPVWVLFASGYLEYYPLVAWVFLASLAWTFEQPLETRSPGAIGTTAALLPLVYSAFAPLSIVLMGAYAVRRRSGFLTAIAYGVTTFGIAVTVCWPGGVTDFLGSLWANMNFGEQNLAFPRYWRQVAGPESIFFTPRYVLARTHLGDVSYMLFWAGGWTTALLLPVALVVSVVPLPAVGRLRAVVRGSRLWFGFALLLTYVAYLFFMVPRLGPTGDVDMFFPTFVLVAFIAGHLLDNLAPVSRPTRTVILPAVMGGTWVTAIYLAWIGLPPRS